MWAPVVTQQISKRYSSSLNVFISMWGVVSSAASMICCLKSAWEFIKKNKLMVHMYIVINTTIFLIVRLLLLRYNYMFRPSMLAIFSMYMKHLTISYIYTWVGVQFVGWGGCEISFCVCRRGMDRVCLGGVVKIRVSFMSTNSYVFK